MDDRKMKVLAPISIPEILVLFAAGRGAPNFVLQALAVPEAAIAQTLEAGAVLLSARESSSDPAVLEGLDNITASLTETLAGADAAYRVREESGETVRARVIVGGRTNSFQVEIGEDGLCALIVPESPEEDMGLRRWYSRVYPRSAVVMEFRDGSVETYGFIETGIVSKARDGSWQTIPERSDLALLTTLKPNPMTTF
jgi:hypothetical protein